MENKKKLAVIGAGISGVTIARLLQDQFDVIVFERAEKAGGLVKCDRVKDVLFHRVGGHVFNSRNQQVLDWFWNHFDRDNEFIKARRNARILLNGKIVGYPIENYLYTLPADVVSKILDDQLSLDNKGKKPNDYPHFAAFLQGNFGQTLYELYFKPYNTKIWNADLTQVPLDWLDGKLPMPNLKQMLMANIIREEEREMVHATFYYPKENGSQFIVDRLAEGLTIYSNSEIHSLVYEDNQWLLNNEMYFDAIVYCGDVRKLGNMLEGVSPALHEAAEAVTNLRSNGTSNVLCETDPTDISWLYLPEPDKKAHRIIYTGNFAESNNRGTSRQSCTVEFSGKHDYEAMVAELAKLPGNLKALDYNYEPNSYVLQQPDTRARINHLKEVGGEHQLFLLGRFAEWEYYNMDAAIEAAFNTQKAVTAAVGVQD